MLSVFARLAMQGSQPVTAPPKEVPDTEWSERFLAEYRQIRSNHMDDFERTEKALYKGMDGNYFSSTLSKLRTQLKRTLGSAAKQYLIDDGGTRPRRYALQLTPQAISYGVVEVGKLAASANL